ncbi:hypothetical protein KS4_16090 [Poriferisphaera corsica]|uniref:Uncharacterized protein n=1 Tax=Poriferisphaera corsica TaxID=2528020 RepID=A0A517YTL8_9BACT|nr:hypothetical protein [Poriferisphaera corsica]QDU33558.1 hypothetical protein KS4_16090 [Poriferisphaera corsica]
MATKATPSKSQVKTVVWTTVIAFATLGLLKYGLKFLPANVQAYVNGGA